MTRTVRDAALDLLRRLGLTRIFANPGSTEVDLLVDLPEDFTFVLGLHEASVVGMATGWALTRGEPALVNLHTTAGLGNAVGALATARVNRAPLVVIVGQQDRRHVALEPFLSGRLGGLAGDYPVWRSEPLTPQEVPGALARAWHEATTGRGPALVIVPMDDWAAPAGEVELAAPRMLRPAAQAAPEAVAEVAALLDEAAHPALVVGAGVDDDRAWAAVVGLAERLGCPVWQESFGARAGFPQDHPAFAGHLPAGRSRLRQVLGGHDAILAIGAPVFRQYGYEPGPLVEPGTRLAVITADPDEAHRSPVELALLVPVAHACELLAGMVSARPRAAEAPVVAGPRADPSATGPLLPGQVLTVLADRLPPETILLEETPSSRPELNARWAARHPLGFVSAAMGGLGFALPAAVGMRMARPAQPVVAVVGDGSALYSIQALWSAAHYGVGAVFVVLANGRYAVMDRLAESRGGTPPWPAFEEVDIAAIAEGFGCPAHRVTDAAGLDAVMDELVPTLAERDRPLLIHMTVEADRQFAP